MNVLLTFLIGMFVLGGTKPDAIRQYRWLLLGCSLIIAVSFYSARVIQ